MTPSFHGEGKVALMAGAFIMAGCHHLPNVSGQSSFEFVKKRAQAAKKDYSPVLTGSEPKDIYSPATPIGSLATPIYPPAALAAHAGRVRVVLQITIGVDGCVTSVSPSLAGIPFYGPFTEQFETAAGAAVALWRFEPAEVRHIEPRDASGTTIWAMTGSEKKEMATEVAFTFTETGGSALVVPEFSRGGTRK